MVRLGVDNTGVHSLIYGCPFCDTFDIQDKIMLIWEHAGWLIAHSPENRTYASGNFKPVTYCPSCGKELPSIDKWIITKP